VVLVGDRGMISHKAIQELRDLEGLSWITALKSTQIRTLVEGEALQLGFFLCCPFCSARDRFFGRINGPAGPYQNGVALTKRKCTGLSRPNTGGGQRPRTTG